jgi:uncharacterized protein YlxW (UPF0749 family)
MKTLTAVLVCLGVGLAGSTLAQEKKEPSAAQKKQQARMKDCNDKAGDRKGRERQEFMSTCLKSSSAKKDAKMTAQQQRMAKCNKDAGAKGMKGDARKAFMSECLKG